MVGFSATGSAFAGFGFIQRHGRTVLTWSLWALAVALAILAVTLAIGGPDRMTEEEIARAPALAVRVGVRGLVSWLIGLGWSMALHSAAMRALADGPQGGPRAGLRLARPEARLFLTYLLIGLAFIGVAALTGVAVALAAAAGGVVASPGVKPPPWLALLLLPGLLAIILLGVRWSLAPFLAVEGERRPLRGSWAATRGLFWKLLGAYVLASAAVVLITAMAMAAVGLVAGLVMLNAHPDLIWRILVTHDAPPAARQAQTVMQLVQGVIGPALLTISLGPLAVAYRLRRGAPADLP